MSRKNNQSAQVRAFLTASPDANYTTYASHTKPGERVSATYFYNLKSTWKKSLVGQAASESAPKQEAEEPVAEPMTAADVLAANAYLQRFDTAEQAQAVLSLVISLQRPAG